jgi:flagellar basal-body rod modification protein FlgD
VAVSPITSGDTASTQSVGSVGPAPAELSQMFLKLLVTQLQNQDPTKPQDDTQFIAELAQFASLEQLTGINKAVTDLTAFLGALATAAVTEPET